ncbi:MAG: hypothetical protein ACOYLQ_12655 [Hyphomicrobiaceae bacterium]
MTSIKMHVWSDDEVAEMQNYIIERDPDLWKRMQDIEKESGDYREREEGYQAIRHIRERHFDVSPYWAFDLFSQLRDRLRRQLGITQ